VTIATLEALAAAVSVPVAELLIAPAPSAAAPQPLKAGRRAKPR
jgi:hypothetical protein